MTEQHRQQAILVVKGILHAFHEKRYADLPTLVDSMEWWDDLDEIEEILEDNLKVKELCAFDEYGAPCNFHPQYQYEQLRFYQYTDGRGFAVDYDLSCGGELADLVLQLMFLYDGDGLKSAFLCVDPS